MNNKIISSLLITSLLSTGCASTQLSERVDANATKNANQAKQYVDNLESKVKAKEVLVEKTGQSWFAGKPITNKKQARQLPDVFKRPITIERYLTLQEAAERITVKTGVPVLIDDDLVASSSATSNTSSSSSGAQPAPTAIGSNTNTANPAVNGGFVNIRYSGNVSGLLDTVAARMGFNWRYEHDHNQIRFFTLDTRTFVIHALPGDTSLRNNVGSNISSSTSGSGSTGGAGTTGTGGGSGGATSTSSQLTSVNSALSVWTNVNDTILSMLSSRGKAITSQSTGTITVTDRPEIIERVQRYVDSQNANLSKQVFVNVRVFSVDLNDADNYSINWKAVFKNVSNQFGLSLVNNFPVASGATSLTAQILDTATGTAGQFVGSDAVLSALSTEGKVSVITSATVTALNNQPTPLQVGKQISYLQSSNLTQTANVGATTTLTPGVINTGFSMNVLPHILDGDKMLLQYAIDISSLTKINTVTSNGSTIQTPEVDTRNFLSRIGIKSGQTLILSGFEQAADNLDRSGLGNAKNTALGGSLSAKSGKTILVVVITPVATEGI